MVGRLQKQQRALVAFQQEMKAGDDAPQYLEKALPVLTSRKMSCCAFPLAVTW